MLSVFILSLLVLIAVVFFRGLKRYRLSLWSRLGLTFLLLLPFTCDIVVTNLLAGYYCLIAPPHPKTKIDKIVEYPISIYWEDNVHPGFCKEARAMMIVNYLDGKHLKTMALNGEDGKIYVYRLEGPLFEEFAANFERKNRNGNNFDVYRVYADEIMKSEKVYTKEKMPKTDYTVTFDEVKLNGLAREFLYADETRIIENGSKRVIAYNRRYMRFFYNLAPDFEVGNRYFAPYALCGDYFYRDFEGKVFPALRYRVVGTSTCKSLNEILYERYK